MQLSAKGKYAVTAMIELAQQEHGRPMTLSQMPLARNISLSYLEQLFARLRRSGLVQGVRGPGGGYRLTRLPENITIAEIYDAMDDKKEQSSPKQLSNISPEQTCWLNLSGRLYYFLESLTLARFVSKPDYKTAFISQSGESWAKNYLVPPPADLG